MILLGILLLFTLGVFLSAVQRLKKRVSIVSRGLWLLLDGYGRRSGRQRFPTEVSAIIQRCTLLRR